MAKVGPRIAREKRTVAAMIAIYCRDQHLTERGLCADCAGLLEYAKRRLGRCQYGEEKPTCGKCSIHCYRPAEREKITAVMRHAGPRMITRHPILAIRHLRDAMADGKREAGRSRS